VNRSPQSLEGKLADLAKKSAILDVNLIKIARKYACLKEEYTQVKDNYQDMDKNYSEEKMKMMQELSALMEWKTQATI
jgi:hypothetical protein